MNIFTNSKKQKKFILVLVLLMLFNFLYPKNVNAWFEGEDIVAAPAKIFWLIEEGVLTFLNNIFTNPENHTYTYTETDDDDYETTTLNVSLTPDNIIKGRFILFDANIFKKIVNDGSYLDYVEGGAVAEGKIVLRETISGWYYALRNFSIVALLSVLVYVGIRMITSTIAQDKAKYKVMFKDWLVALCLVVVMHYLMIGILNITSMITDALGGGKNVNMIGTLSKDITGILSDEGDANNYEYNGMDLTDAYAKLIVMAGIIMYTFIFAVKYLKREFTIIFLILLGPISCITYPIDKISDGKAQAFNKWFSEFLYNVIIQPFHLLLYIVLIGSAVELANANVIYAIVCFAVMIPAEKFIKEMFGFRDKLGSPLGAFAGGAVASQVLNKMKGGGQSGKTSGNSGDNSSTPNELPPKTVDKTSLADGTQNSSENSEHIVGNDNFALESGEEPGGGASAAAAYQNSDDPVGDAERAALEEKIAEGELDEDDLTDEQKNILGKGTEEDSETEQILPSDSTEKRNIKSEPKGFIGKAAAIHNQRMAKKWGSASRGKRWVNRGKKVGKGALKFATKTAATGAGALALGTLGFMVGQGSKGAVAGAALGSTLGNKVVKTAGNIADTAKDYYNGMKSDEKREKKALSDFSGDKNQIDNAVLGYRKNHNGEDPSRKELQQELADRFMLSRYGLNDEQINDCLPMYQEKETSLLEDKALEEGINLEELKEQAGGEENFDSGKYRQLLEDKLEKQNIDRAKEIAASQAKYAANLSKVYSGKDFRDGKVMNNAYEKIKDGLITNTGCGEIDADKYARYYLTEAGKMKSVSEAEIALPDVKLKTSESVGANSGIGSSQMKIKVKEGRINLDKAGSASTASKEKVEATFEYEENLDNRRELQGTQSINDVPKEYDVNIKDTEATRQIAKVGQNRERTVESARRTSKKEDSRVEQLRREEIVGKDFKVQSAKDKIEKKAKNTLGSTVEENLNNN